MRGPSPLRQASSTTGIGTQDLDPAPTAAAAPKPATLSAALLDTSGPLQASPTEDAAAAEAQVPVPQAAAPAAGSQEPPQAPEGGQRGDEGKGPGDYSPEAVVPLRPGALVVEEEEGSDEDGGHGGQDERPSGRSSRPSAPSRALRPTPRPSATGLLAPGSPEGELILPVRWGLRCAALCRVLSFPTHGSLLLHCVYEPRPYPPRTWYLQATAAHRGRVPTGTTASPSAIRLRGCRRPTATQVLPPHAAACHRRSPV